MKYDSPINRMKASIEEEDRIAHNYRHVAVSCGHLRELISLAEVSKDYYEAQIAVEALTGKPVNKKQADKLNDAKARLDKAMDNFFSLVKQYKEGGFFNEGERTMEGK